MGSRGNLLYSFLPENNMPEELHSPPAAGVAPIRVNNPLSKFNIVVSGSLEHLVPRDGELGTTRCADEFRHAEGLLIMGNGQGRNIPGEEWCSRRVQRWGAGSGKDLAPDLFGDVLVSAMRLLTTWVPIATEINIAISLDEVELQSTHGGDVIMEGRIDMPC